MPSTSPPFCLSGDPDRGRSDLLARASEFGNVLWASGKFPFVAVDLDERERELLSAGLAEWGGPARPTNALAVALGFTDVTRAVIRFALLSLVLVAATGCSGRGNGLHLGGPLECAQCGRLAVSM